MDSKRIYKAIKPIKLKHFRDFYIGEIIPHNMLRHIPKDVFKESVVVTNYTPHFTVENYGLIFLSKEYPFPETKKEETYCEMLERLRCENDCCFKEE